MRVEVFFYFHMKVPSIITVMEERLYLKPACTSWRIGPEMPRLDFYPEKISIHSEKSV